MHTLQHSKGGQCPWNVHLCDDNLKGSDHPGSNRQPIVQERPAANATFEDARNSRGGERLLSIGRLAESSLHNFEPAQLQL